MVEGRENSTAASAAYLNNPVIIGFQTKSEEMLLGKALLGARVLLYHGGTDDRRDDKTVFGASF
jgi:hypothetical protein